MCCCPAHTDRTPSLSVTLGNKAILFHCFAGCPNAAVMAALGRAGVRTRDLFDPTRIAVVERHSPDRAKDNARRLWQEARALAKSPAAVYLKSRGLAQLPSAIRYLERTPLGPKGSVKFLPAMLAAVTTDTGLVAVHRTFLDPARSALARFERPRRALGSLGIGAVRLAPPSDERLGLAEGIETALSAMALFGIPCWATLGNERFGLVAIPESVRELHLFVDHDAGGRVAIERALRAYARPDRRILTRAPATPGLDWNDVLLSRQMQQT
ncbi:virulence protein [Altererythrobacter buctensis]|uniref:Virulence protein n=2 Tax=Alteraurantiacibacter buctensis TaxID=1503981 RepID=A0A844YU13_9SPHN|nr:virulence protein [Alteraurantiacibacter buctensis]